ncbi:MAG: hypothetical protein WKF78_02740 [Candidatus Limnocylindrales bacterium]
MALAVIGVGVWLRAGGLPRATTLAAYGVAAFLPWEDRLREPAGFCYWARLKRSIIANGIEESRTIISIKSTDKGFKTTGCGTWTRDD